MSELPDASRHDGRAPSEPVPGLLGQLVLPLVVVTDAGLLLYRSTASLEFDVNPREVAEGEYGPVFDAEGRLLAIGPAAPLHQPPSRPWPRPRWRAVHRSAPAFELVELRLVDSEPGARYRLRLELEHALGLEPHSGDDLSELVVAAIGRFGLI